MAKANADCEAHGIDWRPKSFRRRPKLLAPAWCMFEMFWSALQAARRGDAELIHARSYLPAAAAWAVFRLTGTPFIFDMRALWPEELITAGRLQRGSIVHKVFNPSRKGLPARCCGSGIADRGGDRLPKATSTLTNSEAQKIAIIPTCTNLERFELSSRSRPARGSTAVSALF